MRTLTVPFVFLLTGDNGRLLWIMDCTIKTSEADPKRVEITLPEGWKFEFPTRLKEKTGVVIGIKDENGELKGFLKNSVVYFKLNLSFESVLDKNFNPFPGIQMDTAEILTCIH